MHTDLTQIYADDVADSPLAQAFRRSMRLPARPLTLGLIERAARRAGYDGPLKNPTAEAQQETRT